MSRSGTEPVFRSGTEPVFRSGTEPVTDFPWGSFAGGMAITGVAVLALVLVIWLIGKSIGRYNVIDVGWGFGFVAWVDLGWSAGHGDTVRRTVVTVLVSVWGLRLATYIGLRSRGRGEDPRYAELLAKAPRNPDLHALVVVYLTQALAMWFV